MTHPVVHLCEKASVVVLQDGDIVHEFRKSKGWIYLLEVLRHPGECRYAYSLRTAEHPIPEEYRFSNIISETERNQHNLYAQHYARSIKMADWRTIKEVSQRLNRLIAMEAELRVNNDIAALEEVLQEKEQLSQYLQEVMGKGGRLRNFKDSGTKAVVSVNKAMRRCLKEIEEVDPPLGRYLRKRVRIWHRVVYEPGEIELRC
ncbi:MAG: hypothetical protein WC944_10445 [Candidatus Cloacimonadaceae bacterium]|nr:hypothetical protein [Candidatus Cloacimonadota bacterium]MCK9243599.1 hypothetical protein [Candidatus Cloacimonadota bacterium]